MGWAIGYDDTWKRDIGYGVNPAPCDHPDCSTIIDRGLSSVCADEQPYGGLGCGLYFCEQHKGHSKDAPGNDDDADPLLYSCCERCRDGAPPFAAKPDDPMWTKWKMADKNWKRWRQENGHPEPTGALIAEMREYERSL